MDILDEALEEASSPPSPWPSIGAAIPNIVVALKVIVGSAQAGQLEIKGWDVALFIGSMFAAIVIVTNYGHARSKQNRLVKLAKKKVGTLRTALDNIERLEGEVASRMRLATEEDTGDAEQDETEERKRANRE